MLNYWSFSLFASYWTELDLPPLLVWSFIPLLQSLPTFLIGLRWLSLDQSKAVISMVNLIGPQQCWTIIPPTPSKKVVRATRPERTRVNMFQDLK